MSHTIDLNLTAEGASSSSASLPGLIRRAESDIHTSNGDQHSVEMITPVHHAQSHSPVPTPSGHNGAAYLVPSTPVHHTLPTNGSSHGNGNATIAKLAPSDSSSSSASSSSNNTFSPLDTTDGTDGRGGNIDVCSPHKPHGPLASPSQPTTTQKHPAALKKRVPTKTITSTSALCTEDEAYHDENNTGQNSVKPLAHPKFGHLEPTLSSHDSSESANGIIAEFAKGNKSLDVVMNKDIKNRWLVSFSSNIFIEFFIIHMFGPLSIPYVWYRYGWITVQNLQLERFAPPGGLGTIFWIMWVGLFVLYGTFDTPHVAFSEVFIACAIFLARNVIIAAKYAYFSPGHLADVVRRRLSAEEQAAFLIVSGWTLPSTFTIRNELYYSLKRTRVDLQHMYFDFLANDDEERVEIAKNLHTTFEDAIALENRCSEWKDVWLEHMERGEIAGRLLITNLINESIKEHSKHHYILYATLAGFFHAIIPSIIRLSSDPSTVFGRSTVEVFIIAFAFFVSWFNTFANVMFVLVGCIDYNRRIFLMHQCSAMLTPSAKIYQTRRAKLMPVINCDESKNAANWLDLRLLLKDFGLQYFMRIQIYASCWVFFMILYIAYLFSQLILHTAELTSIVLISYDMLVVMISLIMMISAAMTLNQQHMEHRRILLGKLYTLQRQISHATTVCAAGQSLDLSIERITKLRNAKEMIEVAIQVMDHEDEIAPVRILGFEANNNFLRSMLAVGISTVIAVVKIFLGL